VNKLFEEYNKNKHDLEEAYEDHIIKSLNGKQEHIDVMSKTAFYVHLDDKKLMIETYPHILDKLLQIF
jgi:hypothetical protein